MSPAIFVPIATYHISSPLPYPFLKDYTNRQDKLK